MGKLGDGVCYVCLKENVTVRSLSERDDDQMTYREKLIYCVPNDLEGFEDSFICGGCILLLRGAYKFISMVMNSQGYLKMCDVEISDNEPPFVEIEKPDDLMPNLESLKGDIPQSVNVESDFFCETCNLTFKTEILLQKHINLTHNIFNSESTNINKTDNLISVFNIAKEDVTDIIDVKPQFICKVCNTKLKTSALLERHLNKKHSGRTHYECKYCQRKFKQSWHLQDHLLSHVGDKKYMCNVCDKAFLRASSLSRHFRTHERPPGEKVKPTPFLCTICGKKYIYSNGLQRHMRVHLGIKRHECEVCKRRFSQKTHLLTHTRTHTGEKPYVCDTCGEAFSLNASLRKHMTTHRDNAKVEYKCC